MRLVLLWVVLAGCLQADLVPCGELACPAGDVCLVPGRCVSAAQLASCAELGEGEVCSVASVPGRCTGGACTSVICGNGQLEADEVCDDGNQISGDGCSGMCSSLEVCGNGVVDAAGGEECDCGSDGAVSTSCTQANSDDPSAACDASCKLRYCGDGELNTIEQCDGSVPAGVGCEEYGFYRGQPMCSPLCQISPATCEGRCGDGVIDLDDGEYCDLVPPSGETCLQVGFDLGTLGCGPACAPALAECGRLGWSRVHSVSDAVRDLWGGGGRVAVVYASGGAYVRHAGSWYAATGAYTAVTGTATTVWAIGSAGVARWTPTGWTAISAPWSSTTQIVDAWASDDLGLFVSTAGSATVHRYTTGWSTVTAPHAGPSFEPTISKLWTVSAGNATTFDGTTWEPFTAFSEVVHVTEEVGGRLWVLEYLTMHRSTAVGWEDVPVSALSIWASGNGVFAGEAAFQGELSYTQLWFIGQAPTRILGVPFADDFARLVGDGAGVPYVAGADGVYGLEHGAWRTLDMFEGTPNEGARPGAAYVRFDGTAGTHEWLADHSEFQNVGLPDPACTSVIVLVDGTVVSGCPSGLYEDSQLVMPAVVVSSMWSNAAGARAAAGSGDFGGASYGIAYSAGAAYETIETPDLIQFMAGPSRDDLFVVDVNRKLYHFDGAAWTHLLDDVYGTPAVTTTYVYVLTGAGYVVYTRATGTFAPFTELTDVKRIVSDNYEVFALARGAFAGSPLYRYDGTTWQPIRVPPGIELPRLDGLGLVGNHLLLRESYGSITFHHMLQRTGPW